MERYYAVGFLIIVATIGIIHIIREIKSKKGKIEFANNFLKQFDTYLQSGGEDYETYTWLIHRSPKLQSEMGRYGIVSNFRPSFANYAYKNYPVILNIIPEIRKEFKSDPLMRNDRTLDMYASLISESIIRYIGDTSDRLEPLESKKYNPISWLHEGFSWIMLFPLTFLSWIGILGSSLIHNLSNKPIIKFLGGIITLVGLVSSIVTIIVGWDRFIANIRNFLP